VANQNKIEFLISSESLFRPVRVQPKITLPKYIENTCDYIVIDSLTLVRCPCNTSADGVGRGPLTWPFCLSLGASPRLCVYNNDSLYQISIKRNGAHVHHLQVESWDTKDEELQEAQKQRFGGKMRGF